MTPNGKSRAATQNHAKFVSFCKDIEPPAIFRVPSLEDLAQRRTERAIQVLLDIEDFVSTNATSSANVASSSRAKKGASFYTPTKKMQNKGHLPSVALAVNSSPMVKNLAKSLTKSGMRFFDESGTSAASVDDAGSDS